MSFKIVSKILAWFEKKFPAYNKVSEPIELEKPDLIKKIRNLLITSYPEKLWNESLAERNLQLRSIEDLKAILHYLENPKPKEPE